MIKSVLAALAFGAILSISIIFPVAVQGKAAFAAETAEQKAEKFISEMANDGLSFLGNPNLTMAQKKARFQKLLDKSFDIKTIGRFALGIHWKNASDAEKKEYMDLFEKMVVDVYAHRFSEYNGQKFQIDNAKASGKKDFLVTSRILPPEGQNGVDVRVDWRVRVKDGNMRVIDIIVEGISMSMTQRSDFAAVIQKGQGEVEYLLAELRKAE